MEFGNRDNEYPEGPLRCLDIDLYTHVVNNKEADDICAHSSSLAWLKLMQPLTLAMPTCCGRWPRNTQSSHILEGHSFVEEGITPLGRNYFDGRNISSHS
jgi:hypothetical protein